MRVERDLRAYFAQATQGGRGGKNAQAKAAYANNCVIRSPRL